eukprot:TRINITY_DN6252_c0_g2_i2.p1 TRINITY_DN6252_c0_g2~~TRINITY_DN6252_c0_g2_i2.p1  ORF type:complete len:286 (+),score=69.70 TRINITY_DN6252_c0_g2_i2:173-1030(+)
MNQDISHSFVIIDKNFEPPSPNFYPNQSTKSRTSRACEACKISHTSCGSERPCQRCIKLGKSDTCVDSTPKKRGRKRHNSQDLDESEDSNNNLNEQSIGSPSYLTNSNQSMGAFNLSNFEGSIVSPNSGNGAFNELNSSSEDSSPLVDSADLPVVDRIHMLVKERKWMSDKEWKANREAISAIGKKRDEEKESWTEERKIDYQSKTEDRRRNLIRIAHENPAPMAVRDMKNQLIYVNDAFRDLTGFPDESLNDTMESLKAFHFSADTVRVLSWTRITMSEKKHVI